MFRLNSKWNLDFYSISQEQLAMNELVKFIHDLYQWNAYSHDVYSCRLMFELSQDNQPSWLHNYKRFKRNTSKLLISSSKCS